MVETRVYLYVLKIMFRTTGFYSQSQRCICPCASYH